MTSEVLSASTCRSLCRGAAHLVLNRFQGLARRTASQDPPLALLFADLGSDMERTLLEIQRWGGQDPLQGADERERERERTAARRFLPSLSKTTGEARLDRESGFYLGECLLQELGGLYATLIRQATDEKSHEFLLRSSQSVNGRLQYLQQVVLKGTASVSPLGDPAPGLPQGSLPDP